MVILTIFFFKDDVKWLLKRLASVKFGDHSVEFFRDELERAQELSTGVRTETEVSEEKREQRAAASKIPLTEVNARMLKNGLRPSPSGLELQYYHDLAECNQAIALTGLMFELEIIGQNLAKGFKVSIPKSASVTTIFRALADANAVTPGQYELV